MKALLAGLVCISGVLLVIISSERLVVEGTIGPAAIVAMSALGLLFLLLLVTLFLYKTRYWTVMTNIWLVGISVAVSYIVVDVIAGLVLIRPLSPPLVPDEYRHHVLVPNSYSRFQQRDFNYEQRVNNLGLRGRDTTLRKPSGTVRILMLGDSFTMGKGVEDNQTFSVLLEGSLNRKYAQCSGRTLEVLNGGVDSYAPILSGIQLKRDLHRLEPDIVVLNLDVSDLVQEQAYRRVARYGPDGQLIGVPQVARSRTSLKERVRVWTERHLYVTRLLLFYVNKLFDYGELSVRDVVEQARLEVAAHTLAGDAVRRDEQWADVFDSILDIKSFAESKGMDFVLSAYPWGHQVNETEWQPGRLNFMPEGAVASDRSLERIKRFAADNNVRLANLFPVFRSHSGGAALYFQHDAHWTPAGHEVMARGLEEYLDKTIIDSRCEWRGGGRSARPTLDSVSAMRD